MKHLILMLAILVCSIEAKAFSLYELAFATKSVEVKVNGEWHNLSCENLSCSYEDLLKLRFIAGNDSFTPVVEAVGRGFYLNAIRLTTEFDLKGESYFLSEGFQSWSNSGWIKTPKDYDIKKIYKDVRGDDENRDGVGYSYNYTMVSNKVKHYFAGVTSSKKFQSWILVKHNSEQSIELKLVMGDVGESKLLLKGESYSLDPWYIVSSYDAKGIFENYGAKLKSFKNKILKKPK